MSHLSLTHRGFAGVTTVAFWIRRQAHESTIHRWDAEHAIHPGSEEPINAQLAADGVDEWLNLFVPRFLFAKGDGVPPQLQGKTLQVRCTDAGLAAGTGEWLVTLRADAVEVEPIHGKADAAIRGTAENLDLVVWNRRGVDTLDIVGDRGTAMELLDAVRVD